MSDIDALVMRTLEIIRHLSETIGPRPSGSPAERSAQDYLSGILVEQGYTCRMEPFNYPAIPTFFPYLSLPGGILLLAVLLPDKWKALLAGLPFLIAGLPEIHHWLTNRLPHTKPSHNLLVYPQDMDPSHLDILLCAHVDSARIQPRPPAWLDSLFKRYMLILEEFSWLVAALGLIHLTIPFLAETLSTFTTGLLLLSGTTLILLDVWQQCANRKEVTRGANDNASGAALCTALAEYLQQHPSQPQKKIGFLFTGAEEEGLYGAHAFVQKHQGETHRRPMIINLDMVGLGQRVGMVTRTGRLKPLLTDSELGRLVFSLHPEVLAVDYKYRGGDFMPFLKAGYRAISLEATDSGGVPSTYHGSEDKIENLNAHILGEIGTLVSQIIDRIGE